MAHLNLREHRIEAKIAYVGPEPHILSTFARLRNEPAFTLAGDRMLDWRPTTKRFRDCDIHVKLVVGERDGVDGVVVVERPTELAEELAALERTLSTVLATLDAAPPSTPAKPKEGDAAHPLLTALRQVLRDTVREHVDELALRLAEKDADDGLAVHVLKTLEELDARDEVKRVGDRVDAVMLRIQRFDAFMKRLEKIEESVATYHAQAMERDAALDARFTELIEELKKPKKSWFT